MSFDMMHMPGPCVVCGDTNYTLSCGGPTICAKCDCGNFDAATVMKQAKVIAELREHLAAVSQPDEVQTDKPVAWMVERQCDPTFPRLFMSHANAVALVNYCNVSPAPTMRPLFATAAQAVPDSYRDTVRQVGAAREKRLAQFREALESIAAWRKVNIQGEYEHGLRDIIRSVTDCAQAALEASTLPSADREGGK